MWIPVTMYKHVYNKTYTGTYFRRIINIYFRCLESFNANKEIQNYRGKDTYS